jgi:TPP-dependent 2-oxoacid decarboxylase
MEDDKKTRKRDKQYARFIGGSFLLSGKAMRRQIGMIALIVVLIIFYIDNRYTVQRQQIKIDKLKKELVKWRYTDLARSSELMEISRQSKVEEYVKKNNSDLQTSTEPPFVIVHYKKEN